MSDKTWTTVTPGSRPSRDQPPTCSFCGKTQDKAGKMIGGPEQPGFGQIFICESCVRLCLEVIEESAAPQQG